VNEQQAQDAALAGVVVVEIGANVAAPYCCKLLSDYGATVIKIEPPAGDPARTSGPFSPSGPDREASALYLYLNTGKQSVTLDLDQAAGQALARALIGQADILVENSAPGELAARGLGPDPMRTDNKRLVYVSLTPYGADGPWANWQTTNLTSYATGGQMNLTGDPGREPLKAGGEQAEYQLGLNGFGAALTGLWDALETGEGQWIDLSAQEVMASTLEISLNAYAYLGETRWPTRRGNIGSAVVGIYPCADGALGVHAMPRNIPALMQTIGMPELIEDERFKGGAARLLHDDELRALIYAWAAEHNKRDAYALAGAVRGPVAFVHDMADLVESPQLQHRHYLQQIEHPVAGTLTYPGPPFQMSESPAEIRRAPLLGEHTAAVLRDRLGLTAADLATLSGVGAI
jgi:CoA:oxalate CoA-transferase